MKGGVSPVLQPSETTMNYESTCEVNFTCDDFNRNHCILQFITGNTGVKTKILVLYRVNDQSLGVC